MVHLHPINSMCLEEIHTKPRKGIPGTTGYDKTQHSNEQPWTIQRPRYVYNEWYYKHPSTLVGNSSAKEPRWLEIVRYPCRSTRPVLFIFIFIFILVFYATLTYLRTLLADGQSAETTAAQRVYLPKACVCIVQGGMTRPATGTPSLVTLFSPPLYTSCSYLVNVFTSLAA